MSRFKTFDATGVAPGGRLFAGDLNAIQDMKADQSNFGQTIDLAALRIGDSGIMLYKHGTSMSRFNSGLWVDSYLFSIGGLAPGEWTTATRDAIPAGRRPPRLIIYNATNARYEFNAGSDASPSWSALSPTLGNDSITAAMIQADAVGTTEIADGSVTWNELAGALKPNVSAGPTDEALRQLGTAAHHACAGNDARLADQRTPLDNSVTNAKIVAGAGIPYSKLSLANSILNADIVAAAGIPYSKLNLALSIVNGDVNAAAAIAQSKLATLVINDTHVGVGALSPNRINGTAVISADARLSDQRTPLDNSVSIAKMQDNSVSTAELVNGSVTTAKIGAAQITYDKIAPGVTYLMRAGSVNVSISGGVGFITYDAVFPNATLCVVATAGSAAGQLVCTIDSWNTSGFNVRLNLPGSGLSDGNYQVNYIAAGY